MDDWGVVKLEIMDRVADIRLNRPEKLNAVNPEMKNALWEALEKIGGDENIRVVVLRGEGRAFCTGADLGAIDKAAMGKTEDLEYSQKVLRKLIFLRQTVISAVHGYAAGAGCNFALSADLVFAARDAKFIQSFIKVGLVPDWGGMFFVPMLAGFRKAKEWMLTGGVITAEEALQFGLINRLYEPDRLVEETMNFAHKLAKGPSQALALTKRILNETYFSTLQTVYQAELNAYTTCRNSPDFEEGMRAFLEKRPAVFQ